MRLELCLASVQALSACLALTEVTNPDVSSMQTTYNKLARTLIGSLRVWPDSIVVASKKVSLS
jgi:hypothetical protein